MIDKALEVQFKKEPFVLRLSFHCPIYDGGLCVRSWLRQSFFAYFATDVFAQIAFCAYFA